MSTIKILILIFTFLLYLGTATAQEKFTLNGYVKDSLTGETLIGANIAVKEEGRGVATNQYGFFSITLAKGNYQLLVSFVGYQPKQIEVNFNDNKTLNVLLAPTSVKHF